MKDRNKHYKSYVIKDRDSWHCVINTEKQQGWVLHEKNVNCTEQDKSPLRTKKITGQEMHKRRDRH